MARRPAAGWCLGLALFLIPHAGCDEHAGAPPVSDSTEEVLLKGTVRIRGKPATGGTVTFRAANIRRPTAGTRSSAIGKDGSYTVKTLVGDNYVEVASKDLTRPKNRDLLGSEQTVKVGSGDQTIDINLPPAGAAASP
jgi:hypothetical protein